MRLAWLLLLVQSAYALMSSSGETYTRRWRDSVFVCFEYAGVWHDGIEPFATLSTTDGALTGDNQCVTPLVGAFATSTSFPLHYHAANYKPCCEVPRFSGEATATLWDYDMWGSNDEVGAVTIDLNTLGEQSFTVRDGSGEAAPTWSERISGPGVAGTFNFRLLVTTDPNPSTSVGICLRGSPQHMVGRRCGDAMAARLAWGKTQEGIGMLAAVNALDGAVAETGLLCAEAPGAVDRLAERWPVKPRTTPPAQRRCPIGASPDGLVVYGDGALDVLEVKSVAPFVRASGNKTMELYDRGPHDNLAPWIVPHRA